ncbi:hypothetical protein [Halopiger thermotolerans]
MSQFETEKEFLEWLETCLKHAVSELGLDWDDGTRVRRQKYLWLAVSELYGEDIPVSHSWFLYGVNMFDSPPTHEAMARDFPGLSLPDHYDPIVTRHSYEEVVSFYTNDLDDFSLETWWNHPDRADLAFLEQFYQEYAPATYRDLYLENVNLREKLRQAKKRVVSEEENVEMYDDISLITARMQLELADLPSQDINVDDFIEFSNTIEDVFLTLEGSDYESYDQDMKSGLISVISFYRETVWPGIAASVSTETVSGPNMRTALDRANKQAEKASREFSNSVSGFREECEKSGLLPDVSQYPDRDDEIDQNIDELFRMGGSRNGR